MVGHAPGHGAGASSHGDGSRRIRWVRFVDDLGQAIAAPLDVCFDTQVHRDCGRTDGDKPVAAPEGFLRVRVEGEAHGPVAVRREQIQARPDGTLLVAVPRKGWLQVVRPVAALGLPTWVDSSGQLLLGGLSSGQYDIVLGGMTLPTRSLRRQ